MSATEQEAARVAFERSARAGGIEIDREETSDGPVVLMGLGSRGWLVTWPGGEDRVMVRWSADQLFFDAARRYPRFKAGEK